MRIRDVLGARNADPSSGRAVTIVAFGDSVTQGCFELLPGVHGEAVEVLDHEAVYHARLKRMLEHVYPRAPVCVVNAGIAGQGAREGRERLERDVLSWMPDLVILCFGLNDACGGMGSRDGYVAALGAIIDALGGRGIETVVMTPNMMNTYVSPLTSPDCLKETAALTARIQTGGVMDAYMDAVVGLCAEKGLAACDCYSRWKALQGAGVDTTRLLANHINHPDREMHSLFAASLFETMLLR
jgi:acyl-CoA thioesterase-1